MRSVPRLAAVMAGALAGAVAVPSIVRRLRPLDLRDQVALVTGASRGLGLLLTRELAREGCRLAICARDDRELERARVTLEACGAEVMAMRCDVAERVDVGRLVDAAVRRFGRVDLLVNNAGIIYVGPLAAMTLEDFEEALNVMFWGTLHPILAVLPQMLERRRGRIVNITSIGGKISVPHLLPYACAKFAAVGLSEGLGAELAGSGVRVTTIVPGLMRTGSHLNAWFKGRQEAEFTWFSPLASLPVVSMDAKRAARQIVAAVKRGDSERILSLPAALLSRLHALLPGVTIDALGLAAHLLPQARASGARAARGMEIQERMQSRLLETVTALGRSAARRFHQHPGPVTTVGLSLYSGGNEEVR